MSKSVLGRSVQVVVCQFEDENGKSLLSFTLLVLAIKCNVGARGCGQDVQEDVFRL